MLNFKQSFFTFTVVLGVVVSIPQAYSVLSVVPSATIKLLSKLSSKMKSSLDDVHLDDDDIRAIKKGVLQSVPNSPVFKSIGEYGDEFAAKIAVRIRKKMKDCNKAKRQQARYFKQWPSVPMTGGCTGNIEVDKAFADLDVFVMVGDMYTAIAAAVCKEEGQDVKQELNGKQNQTWSKERRKNQGCEDLGKFSDYGDRFFELLKHKASGFYGV